MYFEKCHIPVPGKVYNVWEVEGETEQQVVFVEWGASEALQKGCWTTVLRSSREFEAAEAQQRVGKTTQSRVDAKPQ